MNSVLVLGLIPKYWKSLLDLGARKNQPPAEKRLQYIGWCRWTSLDSIRAAPAEVVKLLSCIFRDNPAQPWHLWLWAGPTLWGTFVLACSLSQEKIRNYHPGSICFPGSLNVPMWSVWHPNAWQVSCHPGCHPVTLLLEKVPPRRICWAVCATWELHPTFPLPHPHFPVASRKGSIQTWGQREGKGWGNAGHVSWEQ